MAMELSDWFLHNYDISSYPMCSEIQDSSKVAKLTKVEIVALSEKVTPENTKKQLNMELRFLMVSLRK